MKIQFVSIIREFELLDPSSHVQKSLIFDSYTHDPEHGTTKFSRSMDASQTPWIDSTVVMDDTINIGSGEDPRAFYWNGSPCASAATYNPGHGFINKIYIKNLDKWFILIPPSNIKPGKNWSPFVYNDELYFVHQFSPFRVLKARLPSDLDGFIILDKVAEHEVYAPVSHDGFSVFRGGSNGIQIGDVIVGVGHTNERKKRRSNSIIHRPFLFVFSPGKNLTYYSFEYDFPENIDIIDPTSLYEKDGTIYLVTSETEHTWDIVGQKCRTCLYTLDFTGGVHENSIGSGGRRLHWWSHGKSPEIGRVLGAWCRSVVSRVR